MKKETENSIEELKNMVMELHRSAGQLDDIIIQMIESEKNLSEEYTTMLIMSQWNFRQEYSNMKNLQEKESDIWNKLIASLSPETES